ncbi:MAG TPA: DegV family protein [Anaerolineae bacterium]|nr:DegV family protein [Anaerolineae bacterium]
MSIRIVTDSSCDLPAELASIHGITIVPLYINIGQQSYLDGVEMTHEQFYEGLPSFGAHPTTSVPGPGQFVKVYEELANTGATEIISIHIGSALSAMVGVARLAAQEMRSVRVTVFDSGNLTLGIGLLALTAAKQAAAGRSRAEILAALEDQASRTHCIAALDTLEYLRRSGRLSRLQSSLGAILQVKPILTMNGGEFRMERARTRGGARTRVVEMISGLAPFEQLALVHTHAPERLDSYWREASHLFPNGGQPLVAEVTPVIGTHIGPGAAGFVVVEAKGQAPGSDQMEAVK